PRGRFPGDARRLHVDLIEVEEVGDHHPLNRVERDEEGEIRRPDARTSAHATSSSLAPVSRAGSGAGSRPSRRLLPRICLARSGSGSASIRAIVSSTGYSTRRKWILLSSMIAYAARGSPSRG